MTPAQQGQIKIGDETYRRVRGVCCFAASYIDLDAHAAQIALTVHNARRIANAPDRSHLDGASAAGGEEVTVQHGS